MKTKLAIVALAFASTSVFAGHAAVEAAKEIIPLKDGGSLYIFPDGKMGKESRVGTSVYLKKCIDPVNSCSGVNVEGNDDEHPDGRRHQALDSQA